MTSETKNSTSSTESPTAASAAASVSGAADMPEKSLVARDKTTPGERLYKWVVHGGINTGLNETIGMWFMHTGEFGKDKGWIRNGIWEMSNNAKPAFSSFLQRTVKAGKSTADTFSSLVVDIFLLAMGGNLLLVPIKKIDDHKVSLVKKADAFIDRIKGRNALGVQEQADRDAAYDRIEDEVKPSWGRVLGARSVALGMNMATLGLWKAKGKPDDKGRSGTDIISGWVGDKVLGNEDLAAPKPDHADKRWWINTVILETISTGVTAALFYLKYEVIDRLGSKKKAPAAPKETAPVTHHTDAAPTHAVAEHAAPSAEGVTASHSARIEAERGESPARPQPREQKYADAVVQEKANTEQHGHAVGV